MKEFCAFHTRIFDIDTLIFFDSLHSFSYNLAMHNQNSVLKKMSLRARVTYYCHFGKALFRKNQKGIPSYFKSFLQTVLTEESIIFDIGAHAGYFTKFFATHAKHGHVYSFEPGSYAFSIISTVLKWNRIKNVSLFNYGLGAHNEVLTLTTPIKKSGSMGFGLSHIRTKKTTDGNDKTAEAYGATLQEKITLHKLDDIVNKLNIDRLDFIKADIEGAEMRMLCGASASISKFRPIVFLEISKEFLTRNNDTPADIYNFFMEKNYQPYMLNIENATLARCNISALDENMSGDIIFLPEERIAILTKNI